MLKTAVLVSGGGTNLQALIDARDRGELKNCDLALVISSKSDAYALERAKAAGIPSCVIRRPDFDSRDDFDDAVLNKLKCEGIELVVLAGYLSIVGEKVIEAYKNSIINVHPSLIPAFCGSGCYGLKVHEMALERGVKVTGCTVHFVDTGVDTGPIILQKAVEILPDDTPETLQKRVMRECEWILLPRAVSLFCEGRIQVENGKVKMI